MSPFKSHHFTYFRQIVHYPEGHDPSSAQSQSRLALQSQGVIVRQDA
jgi:hypothetical protein